MRTTAVVLTWLLAAPVFADPRDVVVEARAHERAGEWREASDAYRGLEAEAQYRGLALYGEAYASFQLGDFAAAQVLAARSIAERGPRQQDARELYGDALYKQREVARARDVYVATEKRATSVVQRASLRKKIAACDRMLRKTA